MKIAYLRKANDDVIPHCSCDDARITYPPQMDCPWCGCGWPFTCISCRKAFTFAEGVEIETTWEELAREYIRGRVRSEPTGDDVAAWVSDMKLILEDVEPGQMYVILDGVVLPVNSGPLEFSGLCAHHRLDSVPHLQALTNHSVIEQQLANREYWISNARREDGRTDAP